MKSTFCLTILVILLKPLSLIAQYDSRVGISISNFYSPSFLNNGFRVPIKAIGGSIQHSFYKGLGVKAGCQLWFDPFDSYVGSTPFDLPMIDRDYKIAPRWDYKMFDIGMMYSKPYKRHEVVADFGFTLATGKNFVMSVFQYPGYPDRHDSGETVKVTYAGVKYELGYNYLLFKKRMNAGLSVSSRNYFGKDAFTQYNLNVNLGYNFNLLKRKQTDKTE